MQETLTMERDIIAIVSGLPRSGTSMMMRMLEAGGLTPLVDYIRTPDEDNPKGYYEFEQVKQIEHDQTWLEDAKGKVVKMIAALLKHLPPGHQYKVVFMHRQIDEILASQKQMLIRRGEPTDAVSDERMAALFQKHVASIEAWLATQPNINVLYVHYSDILANPAAEAARLNQFLGGSLDEAGMTAQVDPTLYRQRSEE